MPVSLLRLVNPHGKKRRSPFPAYAKAAAKSNPPRKRKKVKRNATWRYQVAGKKRYSTGYARPGSSKAAYIANLQRRYAAASATAAERQRALEDLKKFARAQSRTKKKSTTRRKRRATGGKSMAKRRKKRTPPRNAKGRFVKRGGGSRRRKAAPKRRRRRRATYTFNPPAQNPKRRRRRRKARRNPGALKGSVRYLKVKRGRKKARRVTISMRPAPRKRRRLYHVKRATYKTKKGRKYYKHGFKRARRNPDFGSMLKNGALAYAGVLATRVLSNVISTYVMPKIPLPIPAQVGAILPPAAAFLAAGFLAPKIGNAATASAIQTGAAIALFDTIVTKVLKPMLPPAVQGLLGVDDMGVGRYGMGMGEYVAQRPQLGAEAYEAMALDEYVADNGQMGAYDVSEALADSEMESLQTGYAGGSLRGTAFSSK